MAFDSWSSTYNEDVAPKLIRRGYSYSRLAEIILSHLEPEADKPILEIGTGTGILGKEIMIKRPGLNLIGCDIARGMLINAHKTRDYAALLQCDAEGKMPFRSSSMKYIYSAFMAHSAISMRSFLLELHRILMKELNSGVVIVDLFRTKKRWPLLSKCADNLHSLKYEHGALSNYHTIEEFSDTAHKCGFRVEAASPLDYDEQLVKAAAGNMGHYILNIKVKY